MTETQLNDWVRESCIDSLKSACDSALEGANNIEDYWHNAAWEAYEACKHALEVIEAGPPDED